MSLPTKSLRVLPVLLGMLGLASASAQPKSPATERPRPARPTTFQPSVLCLPLPKLTLPAGSKPSAWVRTSADPNDESADADLIDLDDDGTLDRVTSRVCDGRSNCTVNLFVRRGDCGYYVGGFLGSASGLKRLPGRTLGLADLQSESCHNRGCDSETRRYDGYGYLAQGHTRGKQPPLRVFPGVGIEQVALGMSESELLRLGFVVAEPGRLRKGPLEATLTSDKDKTVASIAYTESPDPSPLPIDIITDSGGQVRYGEMTTHRIEELAELIDSCGPVDPRDPAGRTIHCKGGTLLRGASGARTILISRKVPEPTALCDTYPGLGRGSALEFGVRADTSACIDGIQLTDKTPIDKLLRAGCTTDTLKSAAGGGHIEVRCGATKLLFAADGRKLHTIVPPKRP